MKTVNGIYSLLLLILLAFGMSMASNAATRVAVDADSIAARFDNQRYVYPQEKLHVVTDKEEYIAGSDSIWMRVFVVDAASHKPVDVSRYVYVELRDPMNRVADRVKLMCRNGIYAGCIPLGSTLAEGDYMLSAYTRFAESAGEKYFFKKNVKVYSPFRVVSDISLDIDSAKGQAIIRYTDISTGEPKKFGVLECLTLSGGTYESQNGKGGKRIKVDATNGDVVMVRFDNYARYFSISPRRYDYDVTFHPEGGYLIAGTPCRVAFKSVDNSGRGCDVTVRITDSDGHEVATSSSVHRGMGMMVIVPEAGVRYLAEAVDDKGLRKVFELPMPVADRSVIRVDNRPETLCITTAGAPLSGDGFVVLQSRGNMVMYASVGPDHPVTVEKRLLPEGILQVLLLDSRGTVLSDRLVFVAHDCGNTASLTLPVTTVSSRSEVEASVSVPDGMPSGDFAVTVTDNDKVTAGPTTDIFAQLLLQGDLTGHVECPVEYFTDPTDSRMRLALDILMMTQGWHRYDIPGLLSGRVSEPTSYIEQGQELTGIVRSRWRGKPMTDVTINALAPKAGYAGTAMTDSNGRFHLSGIDFPDDTRFVFQALNRKGDNEDNFDIDEPEYPDISLIAVNTPNKAAGSDAEEPIDEMIRRNDKLNVMLKEVTVTAQKRRKPEDIYEVLARKSFGPEDFEERKITKFDEALRLIAGLDVDRFTYRGASVAIFIDGVKWADPASYDESMFGLSNPNTGVRAVQEQVGPFGAGKTSNSGRYISQARQLNAPMKKVIAENHKYMLLKEIVPFMNVKRIDFIQPNEAILLGSRLNGGVLVITTNDGSGTNQWVQPTNLQVYIPLGYQKPVEFYSPKYESDNKYDELPDGMDRRSTVYWNPSVRTDKNGRASFRFYTNDNPRTTYTVRVEGLTAEGQPFRCQGSLKIRNEE